MDAHVAIEAYVPSSAEEALYSSTTVPLSHPQRADLELSVMLETQKEHVSMTSSSPSSTLSSVQARIAIQFVRNVDIILLCVCAVLYIFIAPFTKVEESFNVQATFDLLYKPWRNISSFDHISFPGVVPRTFIGPLVLHSYVSPLRNLLNLSPFHTLLTLRLSLCLLNVCALLHIRNSLCIRYSHHIGMFFTLLIVSQFHQLFYAGRPLPNIFALFLANLSLALRVRAHHRYLLMSYVLLAVAIAIFRSELCILLFWMILYDSMRRRTRFVTAAAVAFLSACAAAALSIPIDSYYWPVDSAGRLPFRYPELEVFYFNAVRGKSTAWGTSPMHWYFSSALPRALGGALPLVFLGAFTAMNSISDLALPALLFVATYSFLPHKELRFVFYALPAANIVAAHGAGFLFRATRAPDKGKSLATLSKVRRLAAAAALIALPTISGVLTIVSVAASANNYPGAHALLALRDLRGCNKIVRVHVDAHAASTGVSQFVEATARCPQWIISRDENVDDDKLRQKFTHLVGNREHVTGFRVVHAQHAFSGFDLRHFRLRSAPNVFILERTKFDVR